MYHLFCILLVLVIQKSLGEPCNLRNAESGPICVCNSTYCDTSPPLEELNQTTFQYYTTSVKNLGYNSALGTLNQTGADDAEFIIDVNSTIQYQKIVGFGSSFTDSAGQNVLSLPEAAQQKFLESNFADTGNEYSLCRVPIGGSDYSPRIYSYVDEPDPELTNFALQSEDLTNKIPLINKAKALRGSKQFQLIASVWTAPGWMKSNNDTQNIGFLKKEYYETWANYFVKFFEAYKEQGVDFWGLTNQNEPSTGFLPVDFPGMAWFPTDIAQFIAQNLGPAIRNNTVTSGLKLLVGDDQKIYLPLIRTKILNDAASLKYIDGIATHWYYDFISGVSILNTVADYKPDWVIINTEACNGYLYTVGLEKAVKLGNWRRGEKYIESIVNHLEYGAHGWIDWNMALNLEGGPVYINNNVDSPIIVNATAGEFYKQPMYYGLGHFSKFLPPGTVRLGQTVVKDKNNVKALSFLRPDGRIATVIWNKSYGEVKVQVESAGKAAVIVIEPKSINTILFNR